MKGSERARERARRKGGKAREKAELEERKREKLRQPVQETNQKDKDARTFEKREEEGRVKNARDNSYSVCTAIKRIGYNFEWALAVIT